MVARRACLTLVLVMAIAASAGCQALGRVMGEYDPLMPPEQQAYEDAVTPYLVKGSVHSGPAAELFVTALPLTVEVRRAMATRQAQAQGLPVEQAKDLVSAAEQGSGQEMEVILALYTPERERSDLAARHPSWRLWLKQGDAQVGPTDMRQVRDRSSLHEAIYPFWGPWASLWRVRFPAQIRGDGLLVVSGASGRLELKLKLD
jgi:hypothetical protein